MGMDLTETQTMLKRSFVEIAEFYLLCTWDNQSRSSGVTSCPLSQRITTLSTHRTVTLVAKRPPAGDLSEIIRREPGVNLTVGTPRANVRAGGPGGTPRPDRGDSPPTMTCTFPTVAAFSGSSGERAAERRAG